MPRGGHLTSEVFTLPPQKISPVQPWENVRQIKRRDIVQSSWLALLKTIKVMKNKKQTNKKTDD